MPYLFRTSIVLSQPLLPEHVTESHVSECFVLQYTSFIHPLIGHHRCPLAYSAHHHQHHHHQHYCPKTILPVTSCFVMFGTLFCKPHEKHSQQNPSGRQNVPRCRAPLYAPSYLSTSMPRSSISSLCTIVLVLHLLATSLALNVLDKTSLANFQVSAVSSPSSPNSSMPIILLI